jgi:hypothetical protein
MPMRIRADRPTFSATTSAAVSAASEVGFRHVAVAMYGFSFDRTRRTRASAFHRPSAIWIATVWIYGRRRGESLADKLYLRKIVEQRPEASSTPLRVCSDAELGSRDNTSSNPFTQ